MVCFNRMNTGAAGRERQGKISHKDTKATSPYNLVSSLSVLSAFVGNKLLSFLAAQHHSYF